MEENCEFQQCHDAEISIAFAHMLWVMNGYGVNIGVQMGSRSICWTIWGIFEGLRPNDLLPIERIVPLATC